MSAGMKDARSLMEGGLREGVLTGLGEKQDNCSTETHCNTCTYIQYIHTCVHANANHLAATEWSRSPGRARMPVH